MHFNPSFRNGLAPENVLYGGMGNKPAPTELIPAQTDDAIKDDREGPLFRPLTPTGLGLARRYLDRKTP